MYKELIERLRNFRYEVLKKMTFQEEQVLYDAADAIEKLEAKNKELLEYKYMYEDLCK